MPVPRSLAASIVRFCCCFWEGQTRYLCTARNGLANQWAHKTPCLEKALVRYQCKMIVFEGSGVLQHQAWQDERSGKPGDTSHGILWHYPCLVHHNLAVMLQQVRRWSWLRARIKVRRRCKQRQFISVLCASDHHCCLPCAPAF